MPRGDRMWSGKLRALIFNTALFTAAQGRKHARCWPTISSSNSSATHINLLSLFPKFTFVNRKRLLVRVCECAAELRPSGFRQQFAHVRSQTHAAICAQAIVRAQAMVPAIRFVLVRGNEGDMTHN